MAGRWIASPGLQYDEVLFVNAATGEPTNSLFIAERIFGLPVMLMSEAFGIRPRLERAFRSPAGTVVFEVYAVDGRRPPPESRPVIL